MYRPTKGDKNSFLCHQSDLDKVAVGKEYLVSNSYIQFLQLPMLTTASTAN